jgi:transposase
VDIPVKLPGKLAHRRASPGCAAGASWAAKKRFSRGRRVQTVNRLQRLLAELIPGQGKKDLTALQAKATLASVRPRDIAGKTRRRIAVEELADLVAVEAKMKRATAELKAIVLARDSRLMDIHGVGPAPHPSTPHRVSRTATGSPDGEPADEHMLHIAAVTQIRLDAEGRAYYRRKRAAGKKPLEAMRCLKRRLSDVVYRQLVADAERAALASSPEMAGTPRGTSIPP